MSPALFAKSWMAARNRANNGYAEQYQFLPVSIAVPKDCRWKVRHIYLFLSSK